MHIFFVAAACLSAQASFLDGTAASFAALSGDTVSLGWNADSQPVTGYVLRYGIAASNYSFAIYCGTNTQASIANLAGGFTWHFAIEAYRVYNKTNWQISPPSPEVTYAAPAVDGEPQLIVTNGVCLVNAFSSSTNATLQSSPDLVHWQDVATCPALYITPATNNQFFRMRMP